ncbi:MAG: BspA family leucine-rich repeat surface protein [Oscillospiraceae bacterium]|nr:BspA family leucine-rich repeat surface protein [Oscillospiraceae bacterium]
MRKRILTLALATAMLLGSASHIGVAQPHFPVSVAQAANFVIDNPYEDVNWDTWNSHRAALHTHTNNFDGRLTLDNVVLDHFQRGYDILAITDHNTVTPAFDQMPWRFAPETGRVDPVFRHMTTADKLAIYHGTCTRPRVMPQWPTPRTQQHGMIGLPDSNEPSLSHHMLTYWAPINNYHHGWGLPLYRRGYYYPGDPTRFSNTTPTPGIINPAWMEYHMLRRTMEVGGLAVIAHPGRYTGGVGICEDEDYEDDLTTAEYRLIKGAYASNHPVIYGRYVEMFRRFPSAVGMEIFNRLDNETRSDRILWDNILQQTMPYGRNVFGFSNDDSHDDVETGYNWNMFFLPELSVDAMRQAMETGTFYTIARVDRRLGINDTLPNDETPDDDAIPMPRAGNADTLHLWDLPDPPGIASIVVGDDTITINAVRYNEIQWISGAPGNGGRVIHIGATLDLNDTLYPIVGNYVRAQIIHWDNGVAMTQPFGVRGVAEELNTSNIVSFTRQPAVIDVYCDVASTALGLGLPGGTQIQASDGRVSYARINWDLFGLDSNGICQQSHIINGRLELPGGVVNGNNLDLNVSVTVNIICRLWHYDDNPNAWARDYLYNACYRSLISHRVLQSSTWRDGIPRLYIADLAARFIETQSGMTVQAFVASRDPSTLHDIPFTDSNDPDVLALARLGIILGMGSYQWDGVQFRPHDLIDRQSAAVLLGRLVTLFGGEVPANVPQAALPFQDAVASWARGSVYFLYHQNPRIMSNTSSIPGVYLFSPQMTFQSQMMVIAMVRTLNVLVGGVLSIDFASSIRHNVGNRNNEEEPEMKKLACTLLACAMLLAATPTAGVAEPVVEIASGVFTEHGSHLPWRLYSDGALIVDSGMLDRGDTWRGIWAGHGRDITTITFTGPVIAGNSLSGLFRALANVTAIDGLHYFDTSNVTDMSGMFNLSFRDTMGTLPFYASPLTTLDLSGWDTSNVTNMSDMFNGAISLTSIEGISDWDTSNVTNMSHMFGFDFFGFPHWLPRETSLENLDVSGWDTSSVTNMRGVFRGASSLTNLDLSGWNTGNVTSTANMFSGMTSLHSLTLGENFAFVGGGALPAGPWQNVGSGTVANPQGAFIFTAAELMANFDGTIHADTWVRQPHPVYRYDNNPNSWAREYLEQAYDLGLISQRVLENNTWRDGIPRIYIADMAARFIEAHYGESIVDFVASRDPSTLYSVPFTDSTDPDVLALAQLGVIRGKGSFQWEGVQFRPNDNIDRQSAAVLLGRLITLFDGEVPVYVPQGDLPFEDRVASWTRGSVYFLYDLGIMGNTCSQGGYLFSPRMEMQFQMMVMAMVRTLDALD